MKRIVAGLLAVGMLAALSVIPAMAEDGFGSWSPAGEAAGIENPQELGPSAYLRFDQIREVLLENNNSVKALEQNLEDLEDQDTGELRDAVNQLKQLQSSVRAAQATVQQALGQVEGQLTQTPPAGGDTTGGDTEGGGSSGAEGYETMVQTLTMQKVILGALSVTLMADTVSLQSQITTLESQLDTMETTIETSKNTIRDAINQIVKGTETLYIGIATMEASVGDLQRGLDAMDRVVAIYEKQYELGMVSQYDVESMVYQRSTLNSQLESLQFQIESNKVTLEGMCGLDLRGNVQLGGLSAPTAEEVAGISYERDMPLGQKRNVDVLNAQVELENDSSDAKEYELQAAKDTFAYNFKVLCLTVEEKQRLVGVAEEALAFQERTFSITEKQYELGMISQEEYLSGQSDLLSAQSQVETAQLDLFSAYRNYIWARDYGLI